MKRCILSPSILRASLTATAAPLLQKNYLPDVNIWNVEDTRPVLFQLMVRFTCE